MLVVSKRPFTAQRSQPSTPTALQIQRLKYNVLLCRFDARPSGERLRMGDTREVWFIHGGFLYEVTTYKQLDSWLAPIMQTWQFTP
jgi:hypothetical protein